MAETSAVERWRPESADDLLAHIEETLGQHPDVAAVRGFWLDGAPVAAVAPAVFASGPELRDHVFDRLGAPTTELSIAIVNGAELDDAELAVRLERSSADLCRYVPPRSPVESWLCKQVADRLDLVRIGVEDDLLDLGCDSLDAVELLMLIADEYGANLTLESFFELATVRRLATGIDGAATG